MLRIHLRSKTRDNELFICPPRNGYTSMHCGEGYKCEHINIKKNHGDSFTTL